MYYSCVRPSLLRTGGSRGFIVLARLQSHAIYRIDRSQYKYPSRLSRTPTLQHQPTHQNFLAASPSPSPRNHRINIPEYIFHLSYRQSIPTTSLRTTYPPHPRVAHPVSRGRIHHHPQYLLHTAAPQFARRQPQLHSLATTSEDNTCVGANPPTSGELIGHPHTDPAR